EEGLERPLILLVAARRAEGKMRIAAPGDERRRERRPRALARLERVREPFLEPKHLRARAETESELGDHRRTPQPAAARGRGDHVPEAIDDVEMHGVASRRLAHAGRDGHLAAWSRKPRDSSLGR